MKRFLLWLVVTLVLTIPAFLVLTRIDPLMNWLYNGSGWDMLEPLFRTADAVGSEGHEGVIVNVLLVVSFALAGIVAVIPSRLILRLAGRHTA
ncbi:hypothetical protein [Burkholderia vietnamiensis]|uniref:hypothetical protein n=1 Tax=Burkholderia vietnamiensis TaxID=60552 RepID=UPI001CAF4028|nr:hypothetical protein [Burkholderia vietnamiensis]CAG9229421.1 conserved hypothetical protein [Burkholderia vietnamiensis]